MEPFTERPFRRRIYMLEALLLLWMPIPADDEKLRIEGPPFLTLGRSAEFRIVTNLDGAVPVWRIADAPGSILTSVETRPKYSSTDCTVRNAKAITVQATGVLEGDLRVVVTLESGGRRAVSESFVIRLGLAMEIPVLVRPVRHARGGSQNGGRFVRLQEAVNRVWEECGIRFVFRTGEPVKGDEAWFDEHGRFFPFVMEGDQRKNSPSLTALFRQDDPLAVDLFVVRDCHYSRKARSLGDVAVEESVIGVALKEESVLVDDSADAVAVAHELGHVLGLDDLGTGVGSREAVPATARRRLMCSIAKFREGTAFTFEEMRTARNTGAKLLRAFRKK